MKITTEHSASSYGILDDDGNLMDYGPGILTIRRRLGLSRREFGEKLGVVARTVESWEQGLRIPSKPVLLLMSGLLSHKEEK